MKYKGHRFYNVYPHIYLYMSKKRINGWRVKNILIITIFMQGFPWLCHCPPSPEKILKSVIYFEIIVFYFSCPDPEHD